MIAEVSAVNQLFRTGFWMHKVQVLHSVTLNVPKRSIFGFLGANGAGKTTLIQLLVGLRKPSGGTIRVCGHPATSREARNQTGYLPERPYFYEHLTGEQFLHFFGALSGISKSDLPARITKVLGEVNMERARKVELRRYSKGMLQRIGIAQAILHDPEFLILDEPMSGLDPIGRKEIRELIQSLAEEGKTIFFSTHVIPDVEAICDQVGLIEKGRLIGCGPITQFLGSGSQAEIAFSGVSIDRAKELWAFKTLRETPDAVRGTISNTDQVNGALEALMRERARVLWVQPLRPSLESFFEGNTG